MTTGAFLLAGVGVPADPGPGEFLVKLGDEVVQVGGVLPGGVSVVAELLGFGAFFQQPGLPVVGRGGLVDRLDLEVPAFPALGRP